MWLIVTLGLACAPAVDTDQDGLTDREESELGTDPTRADTDEDRLGDGEEVARGTNPLLQDTDADGYDDADELTEGSDPLDPESRIYVGGWPYHPFKDDILGGDNPTPEVGERFPRLTNLDQFRDEVDLYDFFADDGRDVLLHLCATWGPYCDFVPEYLASTEERLRDAMVAGEIHFVTVIVQGVAGETTGRDVVAWAEQHPGVPGPVLLDADETYATAAGLQFYPTLVLLNPQLRVVVGSDLTSAWLPPVEAALDRL